MEVRRVNFPTIITHYFITYAARMDEIEQKIAMIGEEGEQLSYADLARRADTFAVEHLGGPSAGKRLVLLQIRNDIESIVRYLGALRAGHAVILTGEDFAIGRASCRERGFQYGL